VKSPASSDKDGGQTLKKTSKTSSGATIMKFPTLQDYYH